MKENQKVYDLEQRLIEFAVLAMEVSESIAPIALLHFAVLHFDFYI